MNDKFSEFEKYIKDEMELEDIPESLKPENVRMRLEKAEGNKHKIVSMKRWSAVLATVACMIILVTVGANMRNWQNNYNMKTPDTTVTNVMETEKAEYAMSAGDEELYEKIYDSMIDNWPKEVDNYSEDMLLEGVSSSIKSDGAVNDKTSGVSGLGTNNMTSSTVTSQAITEESMWTDADPMESGTALRGDYAGTNVQVEFVDEGDIVKNDGRYLYQLLRGEDEYMYTEIQIVDTESGLKESSRIDGLDDISEFYVWEDTIVVIESLWAEAEESKSSGGEEIYYDVAYNGNQYSKIHIYDITDRSKPNEIHSFTLKGGYKTSRISEGYLYFFSGYSASQPEEKEDFEAYIPVVDNKLLTSESLYLPEESDATEYLLMTSVDLTDPTRFTDIMAAVTWGNYYYVSNKNIYVLDSTDAANDSSSPYYCDKTRIVKFSYEKGQIEPVTEGIVDGTVLDQFAMDEHEGYFRIITTVNSYKREEIYDDITGESLGYNIDHLNDTNSVFVLDENLNVTGSIKDLAEDERVYSARFMGDIGYFVTFRQVDPLFSVDLSDPANPKILGELKISGFSEYLHFYGENLLLGIGYEADEDTGRTEGIKLSMFDVSDPSDVKEINKLVLEEYDNSEALNNHHAVLVNSGKNIIGFMAEGYGNKYYRDYNAYSYDAESGFNNRFRIDCREDDYNYYNARGTYINDTFYLLMQNDGIRAYDINSGDMLEELKTDK